MVGLRRVFPKCGRRLAVLSQPSRILVRVRIVDLFAGAGGLSEGFRQAGYAVLAGADSDPDACATYARNFPEADTICGDLRAPDLRERVVGAAQVADVLVGGPPCQAFSQVRNHSRLIDDPRNSLYREFVRVLGDVRPRAFVMENVPGLTQMGILQQVEADLSLDGEYEVVPQLLDAADYGVPQTRKRLVLIGLREDVRAEPPRLIGSGATGALGLVRVEHAGGCRYELASEPSLLGLLTRLPERLADPEDDGVVTARQALSDLEVLRVGRREDVLSLEALPRPSSAYQRRMRQGVGSGLENVSVPRMNADTALRLGGIPAGGNYRDLPPVLQQRYLTGQKWGQHNGSGRLDRRHYYAYRRLHPDIWGWTLNTKADSVYHYTTSRALSVREFARLQSFPDRFVFTTDPRRGDIPGRLPNGGAHSRYRQVGNAVPPRLAQAVARALADVLATVDDMGGEGVTQRTA